MTSRDSHVDIQHLSRLELPTKWSCRQYVEVEKLPHGLVSSVSRRICFERDHFSMGIWAFRYVHGDGRSQDHKPDRATVEQDV